MDIPQARRPLVAVMANSGHEAGLSTQTVDDKYCRAITDVVGANCIILPTISDQKSLADLIQIVDGILLTGDAANIEPRHYGVKGNVDSHGPFDVNRDKSVLALIRLAHENDVPLLGICRGMQEMNVACGGTLRNDLYGNADFEHHRDRPANGAPDERYGPAHLVTLIQDGRLANQLKLDRADVNSLHEQAVDKLASNLRADAISTDGLVEALHDPTRRFFYGVQWHAEYGAKTDPVSQAVFKMFAQSLIKSRPACHGQVNQL